MTRFVGKFPQFEAASVGGTDPALQRFVESLNAILARIPRIITGAAPINVSLDGDRWVISLSDESKQVPRNLSTFVVIEEFDDILKCVPYVYEPLDPNIHSDTFGTEDNPTNTQDAARQGGSEDELIKQLKKDIAENQGTGIPRDEEVADEEDTGEGDPPAGTFYPGYIYVAKARLLQRTPFDNNTVTLRGVAVSYVYSSTEKGKRTASAPGATSEVQVITPPYFPGDIITASGSLSTGMYTTDEDVFTDDDALVHKAPVIWEDINQSGRQWALDSVVSSE